MRFIYMSNAINEDQIFNLITNYDSLYQAMLKCRKDVRWKDSVVGFNSYGVKRIHILRNELITNEYKLYKYNIFKIYEPKEREITATRYRDRVAQKSITLNYLYYELTKHYIYDNCACQYHKGTDFARNRLKVHIQKHYRKYGQNGYYLKCDVKDFFGSTKHEVAYKEMSKYVKNQWVQNKVHEIIYSFQHGTGLGSEISQFTQLSVLNGLDHYIKEQLKVKHYIRYMDDFILIHQSKQYLIECRKLINNYLNVNLQLNLNNNKTQLIKITNSIKFLGFTYRLTQTGKVVTRVINDKISHERRKLQHQLRQVDKSILTIKNVNNCYETWKSRFISKNCHNMLIMMDKFYKKERLKHGNSKN